MIQPPTIRALPPELIAKIAFTHTNHLVDFTIPARLRSTCRSLNDALPLSLLATTFVRLAKYVIYLFSSEGTADRKALNICSLEDHEDEDDDEEDDVETDQGDHFHTSATCRCFYDDFWLSREPARLRKMVDRVLGSGFVPTLCALRDAGYWRIESFPGGIGREGLRCMSIAIQTGTLEMVQTLHQIVLNGNESIFVKARDLPAYILYVLTATRSNHIAIGEYLFPYLKTHTAAELQEAGYQYLMTAAAIVGWKEPLEFAFENNVPEKGGTGLLEYAASNGQVEIMKFLVEQGMNDRISYGFSALARACCESKLEAVEYLLSVGIPVNPLPGYNRETPLLAACRGGHVEIIELCIAHGADVHFRNEQALEHAISGGHLEAVKVLLEAGANIGAFDALSRAPTTDMIQLLQNHGAAILWSAMDNAIRGGEDLVRALVDSAPQPFSLRQWYNSLSLDEIPGSTHPRTPLSIAVCHKDLPVLRLLLKYDPDLETDGVLALALAFHALYKLQQAYTAYGLSSRRDVYHRRLEGVREMIQLLVEAGVDIDKRPVEGGYLLDELTPWEWCKEKGSEVIGEKLWKVIMEKTSKSIGV